ncbi:hypothetical protein ACFXK0_29055, partial [Nocardia sp. NPDC059177]|uniref:hypothetical protein n=1 Tax=Nocardia sp. NPDC059177 TaxID=3346759 RepID=UPI0036BCF74F
MDRRAREVDDNRRGGMIMTESAEQPGVPELAENVWYTTEEIAAVLRAPNRFGQVAMRPTVVQYVSPWRRRGSWMMS